MRGCDAAGIAGVHRDNILDHYDPPVIIVRHGKGQKQRVLPLHPETLATFACMASRRPAMCSPWWGNASRHLLPNYISHELNTYLHSIGINATAHQLRHWFATAIYGSRHNLRMVQELLGNASPETTAIYTQFNPGDAVEAVTGLNVRADGATRVANGA